MPPVWQYGFTEDLRMKRHIYRTGRIYAAPTKPHRWYSVGRDDLGAPLAAIL